MVKYIVRNLLQRPNFKKKKKKRKESLTFNLTHKSTGQHVIEFLITVLINAVVVDLTRITNLLHLSVLLSGA